MGQYFLIANLDRREHSGGDRSGSADQGVRNGRGVEAVKNPADLSDAMKSSLRYLLTMERDFPNDCGVKQSIGHVSALRALGRRGLAVSAFDEDLGLKVWRLTNAGRAMAEQWN